MPKKRKKSEKIKLKNLTIALIIIIVIAVIAVILVLLYQKDQERQQQNSKNQQNSENELLLSSDNLKFFSSFYLNEGYDKTYCVGELSCKINGLTITCPKVDQLTLQFRVFDIENFAFISCRVSDEGKTYQKNLAFYQFGKVAEISLQNIAYDKEHNFEMCCQYDDENVKSNEFCLPTIKIKSLCA